MIRKEVNTIDDLSWQIETMQAEHEDLTNRTKQVENKIKAIHLILRTQPGPTNAASEIVPETK